MPDENSFSRRRFVSLAAGAASATFLYPATLSAVMDAASPLWPAANQGDEGIISLSKSPYAKINPVPIRAVRILDGFWSGRRATNENVSIPFLYSEFVEYGTVSNFLRLEGKSNEPRKGPRSTDAELYKWIEAVGYALSSGDNGELHRTLNATIHAVVAAQEPDGYLDTYLVDDLRSKRMAPLNQGNELYCLGHMLQAGIACYRGSGDQTLLNAGLRFVNGVLSPGYGPGLDKKPIVPFHPEIEMALVELYRTTGDRRYLDLAGYFLRGDSRVPVTDKEVEYLFVGIPFTSRTHLAGAHAVRAMYACCGATDYYLETGDPAYLKALDALWTDLHERQMYVTGGIGARRSGECFGVDYELPNEDGYCETCAAIGNMMWNFRLLAATGDARYTDIVERALYNGVNSGLSLDGKKFNYRNPLAFDLAGLAGGQEYTTYDMVRQAWYTVTCCPPNIERTLGSLPGYFYGMSKDGVYVHLYDNSEMQWRLYSGNQIRLAQTTRYPWDGDISIRIALAEPELFTLHVRIPGWSKASKVRVNGVAAGNAIPGRYLPIYRKWKAGDVVEINLDMRPQIVTANRAVSADVGRIAFQRGPLVYCMEQLDQADIAPQDFSWLSARPMGETHSNYEADFLGGTVVLTHSGFMGSSPSRKVLYDTGLPEAERVRSKRLRLIPYYAWGNREPTPMQVWIPYRQG